MRNTSWGSTIKLMYSDRAPVLEDACRQLEIVWESAHPGLPQTNGVIERVNGDIIQGARALLNQAGLPDCFWPLAMQAFCLYENVSIDKEGTSPWSRRNGSHAFEGRLFPFGALVYYRPDTTKRQYAELSTNSGSMRVGVFVGYELKPGHTWHKEYRVIDMEIIRWQDIVPTRAMHIIPRVLFASRPARGLLTRRRGSVPSQGTQ